MTRISILTFITLLAACGASSPPASSSSSPNPHDCRTDLDCVLVPIPCCGTCGTWTADQFDSVRRETATARQHELCPAPVPCPQCEVSAPPADITAACTDRRCVVHSPAPSGPPETS